MNLNNNFSRSKIIQFLFPLFFIIIVGSVVGLLFFGNSIFIYSKEKDFGYKISALFLKNSFKFGIYAVILIILLIVSCSNSLFSEKKNKIDLFKGFHNIFKFNYFFNIILISLIDIIYYLLFFHLVTFFSNSYLITNYFTEPVYLLYIIIYYKKFKKVNFKPHQIICPFILFGIGVISMIIGLVKFYCAEKNYIDSDNYGKYIIISNLYCFNYFRNYHISIFIAIFIIPFIFFVRMILSKKYMDITGCNAYVINLQIYFVKFILSLIIYLISKLIYKQNYYNVKIIINW